MGVSSKLRVQKWCTAPASIWRFGLVAANLFKTCNVSIYMALEKGDWKPLQGYDHKKNLLWKGGIIWGCVGYEHAVLWKVVKWLSIWLVSYPASFSAKFKLYLNNKSGELLEYKPNRSDVPDSTPIPHVFWSSGVVTSYKSCFASDLNPHQAAFLILWTSLVP